MPIYALSVLCAQLTRDLLAIAKFLLLKKLLACLLPSITAVLTSAKNINVHIKCKRYASVDARHRDSAYINWKILWKTTTVILHKHIAHTGPRWRLRHGGGATLFMKYGSCRQGVTWARLATAPTAPCRYILLAASTIRWNWIARGTGLRRGKTVPAHHTSSVHSVGGQNPNIQPGRCNKH